MKTVSILRSFLLHLLPMIFFLHCRTSEYRLIGITSRLQEIFYYGKDYTVSAWAVEEERLNKIKLDIKNNIAIQSLENSKDKWKEITDISLRDGDYVLFQIFPESKVPNEFLKFSFQQNEFPPIKFYSYYAEILETSIRGRYNYPGTFYAGGFYGGQGGFVYPMNGRQTEQISQRLIHSYNFLLLFKALNEKQKIFRVTTPSGNLIDFELNSP